MSDNNELLAAVRDWQRASIAYRDGQKRVQEMFEELRKAEREMVRIAEEQS